MSDKRRTRRDAGASPSRHHLAALVLTLAGLAVSLLLAGASDGFYHDDDIGHYIFARDSWEDPAIRWDMWSRPGYNLPVMPVVRYLGMFGCRAFSALQTAGVAFLAYLIARRITKGDPEARRLALLAPVLVWVQPLVMTLSFTTLTETPAALYLALGVWLYLRGNRVWACIAMSALFVTRYELAVLAPVVGLALLTDADRASGGSWRRTLLTPWLWGGLAAMLWAPAVYAIAAAGVDLRPEASPFHIFGDHYTAEYGRGDFLHMLRRWPIASGIGVLALAAGGAVRSGRRAWLPTAVCTVAIAMHSFVYWRGAFASGGYERFLVPLAGPVAALAAVGVAAMFRPRGRVPAVAVLAASAAGVWSVFGGGVPYVPAALLPPLATFAVSVTSVLALGAVVALLAGGSRGRRAAALGALTAAAVLAGLQVGGQVRPLRLSDSEVYVVVRECLRELDDTAFAGGSGWTSHPIADWLSEDIRWVRHDPTMIDTWRAAPPGYLYVWESKYSGATRTGDPEEVITPHIQQLGMRVAEYAADDGKHSAAVYVRLNIPADAAPRPTGPTRRPAGESASGLAPYEAR